MESTHFLYRQHVDGSTDVKTIISGFIESANAQVNIRLCACIRRMCHVSHRSGHCTLGSYICVQGTRRSSVVCPGGHRTMGDRQHFDNGVGMSDWQ